MTTTPVAPETTETEVVKEETNRLISTGWVDNTYEMKPTKAGQPRILVNMQYKSKEGFYGATKRLALPARLVADFVALHAEGHRLFRIDAFEKTFHTQAGKRCSEWQVLEICPKGDPSKAQGEALPA